MHGTSGSGAHTFNAGSNLTTTALARYFAAHPRRRALVGTLVLSQLLNQNFNLGKRQISILVRQPWCDNVGATTLDLKRICILRNEGSLQVVKAESERTMPTCYLRSPQKRTRVTSEYASMPKLTHGIEYTHDRDGVRVLGENPFSMKGLN